jgi:membrane-associated phospholipid phosphatase
VGIRRRPLVYGVLLAYAVLSTVLMVLHDTGVTAEHALLLTLVAFSLVAPARAFVWDWLPFLGVWVMFDDLGALAGPHIVLPHVMAPIDAERFLLGGNVATVWLQQHLRTAVPWMDLPLAVEYLTFFAAPIVFGLWLWWRRRGRFGGFVTAYIAMMAIGFAVYVLYPETPPWLASQRGFLPGVSRITVSLLDHLGVGELYGGADPAPNGAMPSLHVAVPTLIAATLVSIRGWRRWTSWLWVLYPLTMAFATIYLGEHYVLDCVAGMGLGALCFTGTAVWSRLTARLVRRVRGTRWAPPGGLAPVRVATEPPRPRS